MSGLKGAVTAQQVQEWKEEHGDVFALEAGDGVCYLKAPSRVVLSAASKFAQTDPLKFGETLLNNCWLGGDETIKTHNGKFLAANSQLNALLEIPHAAIKKL